MKSILATYVAIACAAVSLGAAPSADELLGRHAATVEACLSSFAVKSEVTIRYDDTKMAGRREARMKPEILHRREEVRYDGRRFRQILHGWGDVGRSHPSKGDFTINSLIHDNDFQASYTGSVTRTGSVQYSREPLNVELARKRACTPTPGSSAFGFIPSGEDLDVVLRGSATARPQTERVNGSDCYAIEGTAGENRYVIWIDPRHGYHMAKIHATSDRGDKLRTILAFKQVGDAWIPAETESKGGMHLRDPDSTKVQALSRERITEFLIAPDHEALRSFAIDDFPNGARVDYHENGQYVPARFIWQDGRPVADADTEKAAPR